jgi:hypothetical protein
MSPTCVTRVHLFLKAISVVKADGSVIADREPPKRHIDTIGIRHRDRERENRNADINVFITYDAHTKQHAKRLHLEAAAAVVHIFHFQAKLA